MGSLWEHARRNALERLTVLEDAATAMLSGHLQAALLEAAEREAHKLSGALGTFGFPRGSELAREAETILGRGDEAGPRSARRLAELIEELRRDLENGAPPSPEAG